MTCCRPHGAKLCVSVRQRLAENLHTSCFGKLWSKQIPHDLSLQLFSNARSLSVCIVDTIVARIMIKNCHRWFIS